ncbi:MAG: DUF1015 domain-containing protein [Spirochaetota bacterium]
MATIRAFRALRPVPEKVGEVASVPYDVVTTEEAKKLATSNPLSFLHVTRPEIDLPEDTAPYDKGVYIKARENLQKFINDGVFLEEEKPSLYLYRLRSDDHEQVGLAGCFSIEEYEKKIIRKHENTRKEKEDDRFRHILAVSAHSGPVLLTYRGNDEINKLVTSEIVKTPIYDFKALDGVQHTLWMVENTRTIIKAFKKIPALYIADGHHRAAGAWRVKEEMLKRYPLAGDEEFRYFLAVAFPSDQLRILPYNRYISDLNGMSVKAFLESLGERFEVTRLGILNEGYEPREKGQFGMYLDKCWYLLKPKKIIKIHSDDPVSKLDLTLFQREILEPLIGITDQKSDTRIDFVGGPSSSMKLMEKVDAEGGVAFTLYPVTVDELMAVSDAGMIMPPKSTWFSPKLRSGLLIHKF